MSATALSLEGARRLTWADVDAYHIAQLLEPDTFAQLAQEFPDQGFRWTERVAAGNAKGYASANLSLVDQDRVCPGAVRLLTARWRALVEALCDMAYREKLGQLFGLSLGAASLEMRAVRHPPGGWIDPHTDRLDKRLTQIIYFNSEWREDWGGRLLLLRSASIDDIATRVVPVSNASIIFRPAKNSWHAIEPVGANGGFERHSLLLHFTAPRHGHQV